MNKKILAALLILLCVGIIVYMLPKHGTVNVSMINLIANPQRYNKRPIRLMGISYTEFIEDPDGITWLFLTKEHAEMFVEENAVRIYFDPSLGRPSKEELINYNGKYVLVEGIFNSSKTRSAVGLSSGNIGRLPGSIEHVTKFLYSSYDVSE